MEVGSSKLRGEATALQKPTPESSTTDVGERTLEVGEQTSAVGDSSAAVSWQQGTALQETIPSSNEVAEDVRQPHGNAGVMSSGDGGSGPTELK